MTVTSRLHRQKDKERQRKTEENVGRRPVVAPRYESGGEAQALVRPARDRGLPLPKKRWVETTSYSMCCPLLPISRHSRSSFRTGDEDVAAMRHPAGSAGAGCTCRVSCLRCATRLRARRCCDGCDGVGCQGGCKAVVAGLAGPPRRRRKAPIERPRSSRRA